MTSSGSLKGETDWDHTFKRVIAALTLVGIGYSACWFQTQNIAIPTHLGRLGYEVEAARAKIADLTQTLEETKADAAARLAKADKQIADLKVERDRNATAAKDAMLSNMFQFGMPYPVGLAGIKVGDPRHDIERAYPSSKIKKQENDPDGYWSVSLDHAIFSGVTYYFITRSKSVVVGQILFTLRRDLSSQGPNLDAKLTELLGAPTKQNRRGQKYWSVQGKVRVYWMREGAYNVTDENYIPGGWRD